ncbi:MAG: hypothetical protein IJK97_01280 [Thermoguttaceae bacterium]|nr:hypothetical protein [Thermoguttaceae bacterium]
MYDTFLVKLKSWMLLLAVFLVSSSVLSINSASAQWWRRNNDSGSNTMPPVASYASGRGGRKVDPTPNIRGSNQNTIFNTFTDFDVFPVQDNRKPYGGILGSSEIVSLSIQEIVSGIERRQLNSRYNTWRSYYAGVMKNTVGTRTGSEINGLGRLSWFNSITADPLKGAGEADEFTRLLHVNLCTGRIGFCKGLKRIANRMDVNEDSVKVPAGYKKGSADKALADLQKAVVETRLAHGRAIAPLNQDQIKRISNLSHRTLTLEASVGHTVSMRGTARSLIIDMSAIDMAQMYAGLAELSLIIDPEFIKSLDTMKESGKDLTYDGVDGSIVKIIETQAGDIIVGGRDKNTYDFDKMPNVCAVVDLGGDDTYLEGSVNINRPVLAILDLHGNDTYKGERPGIQGSSILGISLLCDVEGNDRYSARHHAQAATIGGACALVDYNGDDQYNGIRRVQGVALCGVAILLDRRGNDSYHAAMWSQGTGQTLGCGVLEDCTGDDTYYSGGMYPDSYPETPGYEGWGQGLGTGIRGVAAGGIGVLLEGEGNDDYQYDYIAHGGGYWMGLGFFRDFAGNDNHEGGTKLMWNGSPRRESKFQRFSSGFGCHYAAGFFFEDDGNDTYWSSIMSEGFAWDCGIAFFYDFAGDDVITGAGGGNQGQGAQASLGVMVNFSGDDTYRGSSQGFASSSIDYHTLPNCGGNFSFLLDYGGKDVYGCRAQNNAETQRGYGGFLIDRPTQAEAKELEAAKPAEEKK